MILKNTLIFMRKVACFSIFLPTAMANHFTNCFEDSTPARLKPHRNSLSKKGPTLYNSITNELTDEIATYKVNQYKHSITKLLLHKQGLGDTEWISINFPMYEGARKSPRLNPPLSRQHTTDAITKIVQP